MKLTSKYVQDVLGKIGKESHYLGSKPVSKWDKYDKSNWRALVRHTKYGRK
jgi:hypothetical protein